ncbi:unnamed protein product [[Candida] boidinii]|nr:unnamed protein product [[Candida] boidinii]
MKYSILQRKLYLTIYWEKILLKKKKDLAKLGVEYQKGVFGSYASRRFNLLKPPRPPSIKNLELRIPTIWLPQDDKYLIRYVADYSFNWDIISAHLSASPSKSYISNTERRTAWQCFERYIQLNDKFQFSDMRGHYAVAAKEWLEAAHKVQSTTKRRLSPLGVGIESIQRGHRRLRWGSMFEAIRKLMKKRESVTKPNTQPRKFQNAGRNDAPTPEELSRLKYDREKAMQVSYMPQNGFNRQQHPSAMGAQNQIANHGQARVETPSQIQAQLQAQGQALKQKLELPRPPSAGQLQGQPNSMMNQVQGNITPQNVPQGAILIPPVTPVIQQGTPQLAQQIGHVVPQQYVFTKCSIS